jgi:hypothetical protein
MTIQALRAEIYQGLSGSLWIGCGRKVDVDRDARWQVGREEGGRQNDHRLVATVFGDVHDGLVLHKAVAWAEIGFLSGSQHALDGVPSIFTRSRVRKFPTDYGAVNRPRRTQLTFSRCDL